MQRDIYIQARWVEEASVWFATSRVVPDLVIEAETLFDVMTEADLVLPDLLELSKQ